MLANNAGMQRAIELADGLSALEDGGNEIRCHFERPVYLTARRLPHLRRQPAASVVNVGSGLGFVPAAAMPVYCAAKAALHAFSVSLRHQLAPQGIAVVEVIPPMVDTEFDAAFAEMNGGA